ncbi:beta-lactamase family protein [Desulfopila sp. IMCC35006]|uniref:serine hydrolase domain-containing protein n=1 Tax=Desulfopila sp. IMCC35006 TaxID=2569542 RepID=UPI0010AD0328|nr:serine hydrolase domain-containing protein [Desulfopila sp. IMCC35006]TKB26285.1 beta-lactamase family protein [Desulfopila sp. IMCC35006]
MEKRTADICHEKIDKLLDDNLKKQVFSACSVGYFRVRAGVKEGNICYYGCTDKGESVCPVDERTVFDLASLTKPLVTSLSMLALLEENKINTEQNITDFFRVRMPDKAEITLFHLLTHSSGLPAHRPYYEKLLSIPLEKRMDRMIEWILGENLLCKPGSEIIYSDLGFMLLGRIIEKVSGHPLDEYWQHKIAKPLYLENDVFFVNRQQKDSRIYAATGECSWSKTRLYGQVNDDNCRALGGVAGHAGLFGTAKGVLAMCENILLQYRGRLHHPSYSSQTLRNALDLKKGNWRFGFDTPSTALSSSGNYFSELSIGHLGFTGTSFWIDLEREIAIVVLTNRVLSGEDLSPIKKFRPMLHDAVMETLLQVKGE